MRVVQAANPGSHVHEAPPALAIGFVVVKDDTPPIGDHEIVEAVVVVIADGAAHAEAGAGQPDHFGDVGKRPVAAVPIQLVGGEWTVGGRGPDGTVLNAEKIQPAVVVIVDPTQAAAHRLEDVVLRRGRIEVPEPDPTVGDDVHEPGDSRRLRHRRWRCGGGARSGRDWEKEKTPMRLQQGPRPLRDSSETRSYKRFFSPCRPVLLRQPPVLGRSHGIALFTVERSQKTVSGSVSRILHKNGLQRCESLFSPAATQKQFGSPDPHGQVLHRARIGRVFLKVLLTGPRPARAALPRSGPPEPGPGPGGSAASLCEPPPSAITRRSRGIARSASSAS